MPPFNPNPSTNSQQTQERERKFPIEGFNPLSYKKIEDMPEGIRSYFMPVPENEGGGFKPNTHFISEAENKFGFSKLPEYLKSVENEQRVQGKQLASATFIANAFGHLWARFSEDAKILAWANGRDVNLADLTFLAKLSEDKLEKYRETLPSDSVYAVHHSDHPKPFCRVNEDGGIVVADTSSSGRFSWGVAEDGAYKISISKGDESLPKGGFDLFEVSGASIGDPKIEVKSNAFNLRHVYALQQALRFTGLSQVDAFKRVSIVAESLPEQERLRYFESKEGALSEIVLDAMIAVEKIVVDLLKRKSGFLDISEVKMALKDLRDIFISDVLFIYDAQSIQELVDSRKLNNRSAIPYLHSWQIWDVVFERYDDLVSSFKEFQKSRNNHYASTDFTKRDYFEDEIQKPLTDDDGYVEVKEGA